MPCCEGEYVRVSGPGDLRKIAKGEIADETRSKPTRGEEGEEGRGRSEKGGSSLSLSS